MTAPTDGRHARAAYSRALVVDTTRAIMREGTWRPTIVSIAKRSGRSVRIVFQYFPTAEALYLEALKEVDLCREIERAIQPDRIAHAVVLGRL